MMQPSRMQAWRCAAAVALVVSVAACGSSGGSKATEPTDSNPGAASTTEANGDQADLCKVITAADAAAVFGEPAIVQEPAAAETLAGGVCIYGGESEDFTVRNLLQVRIYNGEQFYGRKIFEDAQPLANVGDEAFVYFNEPGSSVDIQFLKDGKTGVVNYTAGSSVEIESKIPALETVAKKLAASA